MPALTPEQEALKQAALAAVSENWTSDDDVVYGPDGDSVCICRGNIGNMPEAIDAEDRAAFIALANPAAILAILAQLEAAPAGARGPQLEIAECKGIAQGLDEAMRKVSSVPAQTGTVDYGASLNATYIAKTAEALPADAAAQRKSPECTICGDTGKAFGKVCDCGCVATDGGAAPGDAG